MYCGSWMLQVQCCQCVVVVGEYFVFVQLCLVYCVVSVQVCQCWQVYLKLYGYVLIFVYICCICILLLWYLCQSSVWKLIVLLLVCIWLMVRNYLLWIFSGSMVICLLFSWSWLVMLSWLSSQWLVLCLVSSVCSFVGFIVGVIVCRMFRLQVLVLIRVCVGNIIVCCVSVCNVIGLVLVSVCLISDLCGSGVCVGILLLCRCVWM